MASELCMNCFGVKGQYEVCPFCGYVEGTPPKQPHYLTPGTILGGHFIVGTVIGAGGFGIIYKCFDTTLGVIVAVKEFFPVGLVNRAPGESRVGLLSGEKQAQYQKQLRRFLLEAQSVAQFGKARDIVNVYDFFEENGTAYIIMEYIDGVLLKDYLERQGAMHPDAALSVILSIIEAVKKIHSKGIIHRDISPDNIFIASEDSVKIFDFGAAQINASEEGMAGEKIIKVGYSAPEQYRDNSKQGFYTDIYSVGAIYYQMLTGIKPMESTEREFRDELKSPLELGVKINVNTDRAVMEALAVRPEFRFQDIREFEEALLSKRAAEYPKDKLKKRRRIRNLTVGISVAAVAAVVTGISLSMTVLKPKNEMIDTQIAADATAENPLRITVWVENNDQKKLLQETVEDGFKERDDASEDTEKSRQQEKMQQEDAHVDVAVQVKTNMEEALREAQKKDAMPDMFVSSGVSDPDAFNLISLKDVIAEIDTDDYLYLSDYEEKYPDLKQLPTGIDTLFMYSCEFDYNKENTLEDSAYAADKNKAADAENSGKDSSAGDEKNLSETGNKTIDLNRLLTADEDSYTKKEKDSDKRILNSHLASFQADSGLYALMLENQDWSSVFEKKAEPSGDMLKTLEEIQGFNTYAHKKSGKGKKRVKTYEISRNRDPKIYGSNIVGGVTLRSNLKAASAGDAENVSSQKGINPLSSNGYDACVVKADKKMLIRYTESFAVSADSDKEKQIACERLLFFMLTPAGQEKKSAAQGKTGFPIREKEFQHFIDYNRNPGYTSFIEMVNNRDSCILIGNDGTGGRIREFQKVIGEASEEKALREAIKTYRKEK